MKPRKIIIFLICFLIAYVVITYTSDVNNVRSIKKIPQLVSETIHTKAKVSTLIVPNEKLLPSSLENELFFQHHWESDRGFFLLVKDDINTKESPSVTANNYEKLVKSERVRILYENIQASEIDGEFRNWVFIASETGKIHLGWLFKDQLLSKKEFLKYKPLESMEYIYEQGAIKSHIKIEQNGRFNLKWKASGRGLFLKGNDKGQLYIYDDIIWAKKEKQDFLYNFFITDSTNQLKQEYRFRDDPIKMEIYILPKEGANKQ
ncbi:hypothetical protein CL658_05590 [bacterium]|nr:hypothetical protein [bacterium]